MDKNIQLFITENDINNNVFPKSKSQIISHKDTDVYTVLEYLLSKIDNLQNQVDNLTISSITDIKVTDFINTSKYNDTIRCNTFLDKDENTININGGVF